MYVILMHNLTPFNRIFLLAGFFQELSKGNIRGSVSSLLHAVLEWTVSISTILQ